MATQKKYVSLEKLGLYHGKIKTLISTSDATTLQSAKDYADSLGGNYEKSGAATTAESNAKSYADTQVTALANGQVKTNKEAIEAINNAETGILKTAKDYTDTEVAKVTEDVSELSTYVGTIPESATATDVVGYINEKTSGIATNAALTELTNKVTTAEGKIKTIEDDYLTSTDKDTLQGNIDTEKGRIDTLVGTDANKSARAIAVDVLTEALVADNAKEAYDTLEEMSAWIQAHPEDASAMNSKITTLEGIVDGIGGEGEKATVVAYVADAVKVEKDRAELAESGLSERISDLEIQLGDGEGSVSDQISDAKTEAINTASDDATSKASQALADAKTYTNTEVGKDRTRLDALEATTHTHTNKTVLDGITTEKVTAWDAAEGNAKTYADGLDSAMNTRVEALESIDHSHSNKAELDLVKSGDVAKWDASTELINSFEECSESDINALFTA